MNLRWFYCFFCFICLFQIVLAQDFSGRSVKNETGSNFIFPQESGFFVNVDSTFDIGGCHTSNLTTNTDFVKNCEVTFEYEQIDSVTFVFTPIITSKLKSQKFLWDFGDGTTAETQYPMHVFPDGGLFTVTLYYETEVCNASYSLEIITGNKGVIRGQLTYDHGGIHTLWDSKVWLIGYDHQQNELVEAVDIGDSGYYEVICQAYCKYYIKVIPVNNIPMQTPMFIPTYYGDAIFWQNANGYFVHQEIQTLDLKAKAVDFMMTGLNAIRGRIEIENKPNDAPITIYLTDGDKNPIDFALVENDRFYFNHIPKGTYYLYPECPGKLSEYNQIVFEHNSHNQTNVSFAMTSTQISLVGLDEMNLSDDALTIFPNPIVGLAKISSDYPIKSLHISSIDGRSISQIDIGGKKTIELNLDFLITGLYLLSAETEHGVKINKKIIKK